MNKTIKPLVFKDEKDMTNVWVGPYPVAHIHHREDGLFEVVYRFPIEPSGKKAYETSLESAKYIVGFVWDSFLMHISQTELSEPREALPNNEPG